MSAVLRTKPAELSERDGYVKLRYEGIMYCPYYGLDEDFTRCYARAFKVSSISVERFWTIYLAAKQSLRVPGAFFECGVFAGGSAAFIAEVMVGSGKKLHLFDTFKGMPECDPEHDLHLEGDFADCPVEMVRETVGHKDYVTLHPGFIPDTFSDVGPIAFAHIDVDIYKSMRDCLRFIYPRLSVGGVLVIDDYGQYTCPGAREAVDEYFADKSAVPFSFLTAQALVVKIKED